MSTNVREGAPSSQYELQTSLPDWCALTWYHAATCALFVLIFIWFSYLPVSDAAVWNAVSLGGMTSQMNVVETLPLSEGMRISNMNWGANTIVHFLHTLGNAESLSLAFAVLKTMTLLLWAYLLFQAAGRWAAVAAIVPLVLCTFFELDGMTSSLLGQAMLPILVLVLIQKTDAKNNASRLQWRMFSDSSLKQYVVVGAIFVAWANLHASFVIGLLLLFLFAAAKFAGFGRVFSDREFRARVYLFEFALLATLLNPAGIYLWAEWMWWPDNPVLQSFGGWSPMVLAGWNGIFVALFWAVWFAVNRNQKPLDWFLTLAIVTTTVGAACCEGLVAWFAPLMIFAIALAYGANASRRESVQTSHTGSFRFAFTLIAGLCLWLGFCCSPAGSMLLGGSPRAESQVVGDGTPVVLKQFLTKNQPVGLVWCPVYWSDWLAVGSDSQFYVNSNPNLVPAKVSKNYREFFEGENWKHLADKYNFSNIVIDKKRQGKLTSMVRRSPGDWKIVFEDDISILLERVTL